MTGIASRKSQNLHPWLALGAAAYDPEMRQRKLELFFHDFHYPSDVVSHAFINSPQQVLTAMLGAQIEKTGADITIIYRSPLSIDPGGEEQVIRARWNLGT